MLRREQIERLKERYPAGTVVRLGQMEGEHQMPSGMEGKVIDVDDIGQIHVEWENGSTLARRCSTDHVNIAVRDKGPDGSLSFLSGGKLHQCNHRSNYQSEDCGKKRNLQCHSQSGKI